MSLMSVSSGKDLPNDINVVIEIPAFSDPVKYEVDKETGALMVDRFMGTSMQYPTNYGYVPHSLSDDGDPVDVLVITPAPLLSGCVVRCRPIGVLKMTDEAGADAKVLAVPVQKLTPFYNRVNTYEDIPESKLAKIAHFFEHYKDLEPGKWVKIEGWFGLEEAREEIMSSIERYKAAKKKPHF
ncbi:inorganic diphosphatase [Methylobacter sp. YRD-M1]|uniref:inorganic diphosphatase n=1 Tax=Methylobacter sp. YRD-M1 TaxID=2911520 RepID=UPI00227BB677|nr:inorganic diphosphatase [Methylobacter sp. YRD-M1]WAK01617.1 inorganic diphosphatase [Methylobacter sp. YRD-M1]